MKNKLLKILYNILAIFTNLYTSRTKPVVIWITWSVWKTSCRMIISGILSKYLYKKIIYTSNKNYNSELGLIFSIFKISNYKPWFISLLLLTIKIIFRSIFTGKQYDIIILEYWIDHPWDMDFLLKVCKPDYSIFTKLDKIHSIYFKTSNWIGNEKIKLIKNTKIKTYLNPKDDFCKKIFNDLEVDKKYYPDIKKINLITHNWEIMSEINYNNELIKTNLLWEENIQYLLLWLEILKNFTKQDIIIENTINIEIQPWRYSIFQWINKNILIDSTYNAWPESMKKMIKNIFFLKENLFKNYKIILVLWDMRELWEEISKNEHEKLYNNVKKADLIYTVWKEMQYLVDILKTHTYKWILNNYKNSTKAWIDLKKYLDENKKIKHIVLFKWSQNTIYIEEALKQILKNKEDEARLVRQSNDWMNKKLIKSII